jgi:hypothetical protein
MRLRRMCVCVKKPSFRGSGSPEFQKLGFFCMKEKRTFCSEPGNFQQAKGSLLYTSAYCPWASEYAFLPSISSNISAEQMRTCPLTVLHNSNISFALRATPSAASNRARY